MSDRDYQRVFRHSEAEHYAIWYNATAAQKYITKNFRNAQGKVLKPRSWWDDFFAAWFDESVDVIALLMDRQEGKTTAVISGMKFELVTFFDRSFAILANSEKQSQKIVTDKFVHPLAHEPRALLDLIHTTVKSGTVSVPLRRSELRIETGNMTSNVGGSVQVLFIEEASGIEQSAFESLAFSVRAQANRKIVLASTPDEPEGWYYHLCDSVRKDPESYPRIRLINPEPEDHSADLEHPDQLFYQLNAAGAISDEGIGRNLHAKFIASGDRLVDPKIIDAAVSRGLNNRDRGPRYEGRIPLIFGFGDTSRKVHLTSNCLVEVVDEEEQTYRPLRWSHWDPKEFPYGRMDMTVFRDDIEYCFKHFDGIYSFSLDDTDGSASDVLLHFEKTVRSEVEPFYFKRSGNMEFWSPLCNALYEERLPLPDDPLLIRELKNLRTHKNSGGRWAVKDKKQKLHADKAVSLAGAVFKANEYLNDGLTAEVGNLMDRFKHNTPTRVM